MKKFNLAFGLLICVLFSFQGLNAQDKLYPKDRYDIIEADDVFNNAWSRDDKVMAEEALKLYKEVYNKNMGNAYLNMRIASCHLIMNEFKEALSYCEDVNVSALKKKDYEFFFVYGRAYQGIGEYNKALEKLNEFKEKAKPAQFKLLEGERYIKQCTYAIAASEEPVSAIVTSLGDSINSGYDDYHPTVSADGKTFMFTSRRADSKGGEVLADGQYYEDIYIALWNEDYQAWGESHPVQGALNSAEYDANCSITADGSAIYVYRNTTEENKKFISPTGKGDIYLSTKGSTGRWGAPKLVEGLNSPAFDAGASISADGKTMFFISNRMYNGSQGGKDIWVSKVQEDGTWGKAENLGAVVNTPYEEISVFIHPDGKTLFFSSNGHDDKNFGGFDIFRTTFENGQWTAPQNLGAPINSHFDEKEFVLSTDGSVAWMSTKRNLDQSDVDIFEVDLSHYNALTGESDPLSILKGMVTDASTGLPIQTVVKIKNPDGEILEVKSKEDGSYFATVVSNKSYQVMVDINGYVAYNQSVEVIAPKKPKSRRKKTTNRRGKTVDEKRNTETHTVVYNIEVVRTTPIEVVSKDLFKKQTVAFVKGDAGYQINEFSKGILDMYAHQLLKAPDLKLNVTGHFFVTDNSDEQSKLLADLVVAYLIEKGAKKDQLNVMAEGANAPIADNDTPAGKSANARVELMIVF